MHSGMLKIPPRQSIHSSILGTGFICKLYIRQTRQGLVPRTKQKKGTPRTSPSFCKRVFPNYEYENKGLRPNSQSRIDSRLFFMTLPIPDKFVFKYIFISYFTFISNSTGMKWNAEETTLRWYRGQREFSVVRFHHGTQHNPFIKTTIRLKLLGHGQTPPLSATVLWAGISQQCSDIRSASRRPFYEKNWKPYLPIPLKKVSTYTITHAHECSENLTLQSSNRPAYFIVQAGNEAKQQGTFSTFKDSAPWKGRNIYRWKVDRPHYWRAALKIPTRNVDRPL